MNPAELHAFLDELEKIAISKGRLRMSKTRSGRRPMSVETMLRKEKDGSFYKDAGLIDSAYGGHGYSQESTASPGPQVGKPASGKRKAGDAPSLDEPSSYPKTEQVQTNQSTTAPYRMM
jgi:hypothetical protein